MVSAEDGGLVPSLPSMFSSLKKRPNGGVSDVIGINNTDDAPIPDLHFSIPTLETQATDAITLTSVPSTDRVSALIDEADSSPPSSVSAFHPDENNTQQTKKKKRKSKHKNTDDGWNIWTILWGGKHNQQKKQPARTRSSSLLNRQQTRVSKMGGVTTWVSCMTLCLWDNIFGPRVEQVWNGIEEIELEHLAYIGRHALSGELDEKELHVDSDPETKMHVFADHIVIDLLFTAPLNPPALSRLALQLVVRKEYLQRLLVIYSYTVGQMYRLVYKLRALLLRPNRGELSNTLLLFSTLLETFTSQLEAVFYSSLSSQTFPSSLFCNQQQHNYSHDFLTRVITSHLQTHGCTVVIGPSVELVNMFVDTLSMFLSLNERERSSHSYEGRAYVPGLILQGLVGVKVSEEEVILSSLPTTIVDLDKQTVLQTRVYHEYVRVRRQHMNLEIEELMNTDEEAIPEILSSSPLKRDNISTDKLNLSGNNTNTTTNNNKNKNNNSHNNGQPIPKDKPSLNSSSSSSGSNSGSTVYKQHTNEHPKETVSPTADLIRPLREASPYIGYMIKETFNSDPVIREACVTQFIHLLKRKAILLIKYVEAESKKTTEPMLSVEVIKNIRGVLEVNADADFLVVLGIAEKLCPEIYARLDVDPLVMEEKIVELFDQFAF